MIHATQKEKHQYIRRKDCIVTLRPIAYELLWCYDTQPLTPACMDATSFFLNLMVSFLVRTMTPTGIFSSESHRFRNDNLGATGCQHSNDRLYV